MTCCFFGHSNCPDNIRQNLKDEIVKIMGGPENVMFYVGHQGQFDSMVRSILKELIKEGMEVNYAVVLAYMPGGKYEFDSQDEYADTMFPEGLENVHPKYAISWRNNWMISKSDIVICYVMYHTGGAYQFVEKARRKGKEIINLADM